MPAVIRCEACYKYVKYDGEPHLDAWGRPCKPLPIWPIPVAFLVLLVSLMALGTLIGWRS